MRKLKVKGVKLPKGARTIYHYIASAYCIAKPARLCATFVFDPEKGKIPKEGYCSGSILVQNNSVEKCIIGKWYQLAYLVYPSGTMWWEVV